MAGLKKRKQQSSGSPNIVLVIFLAFFFILTIALGLFTYFGYAGQDEYRRGANTAKDALKGEKNASRYYSMTYRSLRGAVGDRLEVKEEEQLGVDLEEFNKEGFGVFDKMDGKEDAKKLMDKLKGRDLLKELEAANKLAKDWEGKTAAAVAENKRMEKFITDQSAKNAAANQDAKDQIAANNAAQLKDIKRPAESFNELQKLLESNRKDLEKNQAEYLKFKDDTEERVKNKERELEIAKADLKKAIAAASGGQQVASGKGAGETFPLVLDISPGRPLWDFHVGRIKSVNMELRQVVIDIGADQGAKPELTFNIFGANTSGRAALGQLKATIEIIKVNPNNSLCRITSLYDADGREIALQGRTRFQVQRETEASLREGDLLYNLFWKSRVAIAGYVNITGESSENPSPAEQKRQMDDFIHLLERQGMKVDAYVDMLTGKQVGEITAQTRYLIRGYGAGRTEKAAPKGDDEKPKEPAPNADRNETFNKSVLALRDEAKDLGLLQIRADNFLVVIGYRRARSANSEGPSSSFVPQLPSAGRPAVVANPDDAPRDPPAKKAPDDKKDP